MKQCDGNHAVSTPCEDPECWLEGENPRLQKYRTCYCGQLLTLRDPMPVEERVPRRERAEGTRESGREGGVNLFDLDSVAMDSPRLAEIKASDIQTHHAPHMEEDPWLAIPMHAARKCLAVHITKDEPLETVADITASFGRILDDRGLLFFGATERDAQDAALEFLAND